jgi:hypothetical protein
MESDVNKRPSVRPLRGLWEAGEAPRAAKPGDCVQKLRLSRTASSKKRMVSAVLSNCVKTSRTQAEGGRWTVFLTLAMDKRKELPFAVSA